MRTLLHRRCPRGCYCPDPLRAAVANSNSAQTVLYLAWQEALVRGCPYGKREPGHSYSRTLLDMLWGQSGDVFLLDRIHSSTGYQ